jgi:hypothetical protein
MTPTQVPSNVVDSYSEARSMTRRREWTMFQVKYRASPAPGLRAVVRCSQDPAGARPSKCSLFIIVSSLGPLSLVRSVRVVMCYSKRFRVFLPARCFPKDTHKSFSAFPVAFGWLPGSYTFGWHLVGCMSAQPVQELHGWHSR